MILHLPTAILLDETPLSLLTMRLGHVQGDACKAWYAALEEGGHRFYVPEIADYELRRELLRAGKSTSLSRLDAFTGAESDRYLPLSTVAFRLAAELWAQVRSGGKAGAADESLDGDVLIAAQAKLFRAADHGLAAAVVATANVKHIAHLVPAVEWHAIIPDQKQ